MDDKQLAYRLTSILLDYPEDLPQLNMIRKEVAKLKNNQAKELLLAFIDFLESKDIEQLCKDYVETFDFDKNTTLYVTYPKLGDKQERGKSLVEIKSFFDKAELDLDSTELPDYLPLLLEFASIAPKELSEEILNMYVDSIEELYSQLVKKDSIYQKLIKTSLILVNQKGQAEVKGGVS